MQGSRVTSIAITLALCLAGVTAAGRQASSGLDPAEFDTAVRPQDDLFRYVNGRWLQSTAIPPEKVTYDTFVYLVDKVEADLRGIIEEIAAKPSKRRGSAEQQIGDLYASLMDEARIEALGDAPIRPELDRIYQLPTPAAFAAEAGRLSAEGVGGPFDGSVAVEPQSGELVVQLTQSGILLPDRDYYLASSPRYLEIRSQYLAYLSQIFTLVGRPTAKDEARAVLALETELARAQWSQTDSRDPLKIANRFAFGELPRVLPGFDWKAWARPQGIDQLRFIVLGQPSFFKRFAELSASVPLDTWKGWLAARYITASAPFISRAFSDARFDFFGTVLSGQEVPRTRWRRGVSLVNGYLGDAVGRIYVRKYFPPEARTRVQRMVANIVAAFRDAIDESTWMTGPTKNTARRKLARLSVKIGYPDGWRGYQGLEIKADDLFGNILRARQFESGYRLSRVRGTSTRDAWLIAPQTPNAYYGPAQNELVVTAALLQPPVFDLEADDAVNYGAIGAIVGHEIGHAFDDRGRFHDGSGTVRDWWTPEDERGFGERAQRLVEQFGEYRPAPGMRVNGALTRSENIGDLAGLSIAHRAYRRSLGGRSAPAIDGLTGDQRFFLAWARVWRGKVREEYLQQWLLSTQHAPTEYRANGPVSNLDAFYEAFHVRPGDRLWRDPSRRVRLW